MKMTTGLTALNALWVHKLGWGECKLPEAWKQEANPTEAGPGSPKLYKHDILLDFTHSCKQWEWLLRHVPSHT